MTCKRGIKNGTIYSRLVPMPVIPRWQHGNTLVWTAVTGGNTPVGTAAESRWSSSSTASGTAAGTKMGALALPGFLVCIHTEALEAPNLSNSHADRSCFGKSLRRELSWDVFHQPGASTRAENKLTKGSPPTSSAPSMSGVPCQPRLAG